jgi:hypothetical protein
MLPPAPDAIASRAQGIDHLAYLAQDERMAKGQIKAFIRNKQYTPFYGTHIFRKGDIHRLEKFPGRSDAFVRHRPSTNAEVLLDPHFNAATRTLAL